MKFVLSHPLDEAGMELLRKSNAEIYIANSADSYSYLDEIKTADAFIIRVAKCDAAVMDACPNLKVIGRTGVGFDSIDIVHANKLGIPVVVTPGANNISVAEHVVALMFALAKNLCEADAQLRAGNWQIRDAHKTFELANRKIGIVGVGAIGREVARLCRGIGMKTAGLDTFCPENVEAAGCERYDDLNSLLRDCDVITLHSPLTPETRNMITAKEFEIMKPGAMLINTSRGPIVNAQDLADALNSGKIACAGVDVFEEEPAERSDPVFSAKNMICTPHTAALTNEGSARMAYMCVEGCLVVCNGGQWLKVADKKVYEHPRFNGSV